MVKYRSLIQKLMSNVFFRIILCMIVLTFGAMFVKFSNSMASYARNVEYTDSNKQNAQVLQETVKEDKISSSNNTNNNKYKIDNSWIEYIKTDSEDSQFITVATENLSQYPEGWGEVFNKKIVFLQKIFPTGKYWNHMGLDQSNPEETNNIFSVTDIPCNHNMNGELYCNAHYGKSDEVYPYEATCSQCRGFASLLSDLVFGKDAPVRYFEDYDELRIGDQARIDEDYHSVFIIDKTDEYVIVAECNNDLNSCQISWGRKILREDMAGWYISRWSE